MNKNIGLLTCKAFPDLYITDQTLIPKLLAYDIDAKPVIWDEIDESALDFDAVIFRNTWDYFEKTDLFLGFLDMARWPASRRERRPLSTRAARPVGAGGGVVSPNVAVMAAGAGSVPGRPGPWRRRAGRSRPARGAALRGRASPPTAGSAGRGSTLARRTRATALLRRDSARTGCAPCPGRGACQPRPGRRSRSASGRGARR